MGFRNEGSRYRDRRHAGQALGWRLVEAGVLERFPEPRLVLGLPRGGVPVANEVARILAAPLDVFLVRKLGVPGHEELAMGAIASGGTRVLNEIVIERLGVSPADLEAVARSEAELLARRERAYRDDRPAITVKGATVIVVDDGLATGASMRAAVRALQAQKPAAVVVGVPVGSPETCRALRAEADEVVCVRMPDRFLAVGQAYADFSPTTDDEVRSVLGTPAHSSN
ncbi:MAG: phosphoribosyltransferase [Actinobacteria bacterium]|nr:phosphoribosyltransferase [Actinomycetota bacterium]